MSTVSHHANDVVIVGGGIVGAATAYELLRHGITATLIEKDTIAAGQSGRNWGFIRQQGRSPQELPLIRAANRRWQELEDETGESFDWVQGGNLALATDADSAARYHAWTHVGAEHGVDTRIIDAAEVERLVPGLRLPFTAAMYAASDGHADPVAATTSLARAAERGGARILRGHTARRIDLRGGRVTGVTTDHGTVPADVVICAAGSASRRLLKTAGLRLPQNVVRGTVAMTEPVAPLTEATVWAPGLAFRQRPDGRLIISTGGGGEVDMTLDAITQARLFLPAFRHNHRRLRLRVNGALIRDLRCRVTGHVTDAEPMPTRSRARRSLLGLRDAIPDLAHIRLEHAWAGLIDSTPDALPVIDHLSGPSGLLVAAGCSGHGFGLAPAIGRIVADTVAGTAVGHDLAPFRLSRFAERDFHAPDAIL